MREGLEGAAVGLTTADGVTLSAHAYAPAGPPWGRVLLMPALAAPSRTLRHLAAALCARGLFVLRADHRHTAASGPPPSRRHDASMHGILMNDVPVLLAALEARAPNVPTACAGHSLGGQLSALAAAAHKDTHPVHAVMFVTVGMPYEALWPLPRRLGPMAAFRLWPAMAALWGHLPPKPWGMGEALPRTLISEWGRWGRTGRYCSMGQDLDLFLAQVTAPVLAVGATDDLLYAPEVALRAYEGRLVRAPLTRLRLSPQQVGARRLGHFGLLWPPAVEALTQHMVRFLAQALPQHHTTPDMPGTPSGGS